MKHWWLTVCWLILPLPLVAETLMQKGRSPSPDPERKVFVHLFEWKWTDIAQECETWLGPKGYSAVQISPPNEHRLIDGPDWNPAVRFPWYQRYQPVSYKLSRSRSGTRAELATMIQRCHQVGVKIYADVVLNHMVGLDAGQGVGSAGTPFDASQSFFPGVPYGAMDFHAPCDIGQQDYQTNPWKVRHCRLVLLLDLKTEAPRVQQEIAHYLNDLLSLGVAGFRIDAAKHIQPRDIAAILARTNDLHPKFHPAGGRPFVFQEVINAVGEPIRAQDYFDQGAVTEFRYGSELGGTFRRGHLQNLRNFGEAWGLIPSPKAIVFTNNHDNQRGHGAGAYGQLVTFYEPPDGGVTHTLATVFMLAWPYGYPRVMSSYDWPRDIIWDPEQKRLRDRQDWVGPPSDPQGHTRPVTCGEGWVCEHRWRAIANMVAFRNYTQSASTVDHWWDNGNNQIAFSRGDRGFVVINREQHPLERTLTTGLPPGQYCNVIVHNFDPHRQECEGPVTTVNAAGKANVFVKAMGAMALHGGAKPR